MRVFHLTSSFPLHPASISGIFIYRLVCHFPPEIRPVVLTPDSRTPKRPLPGNYSLRTFRYGPKQWQILAHEPGGLPAAMRRARGAVFLFPPFLLSMLWHTVFLARNSDLVHAHWTVNGAIAGIAGRLTGTPVITTLRGEDVNQGRSTRLNRLLLSLCLRFSERIVTVSSSMYDNLRTWFPAYASQISFIPNGVDDALFSIPRRCNTRGTTILVLGSLIPVKGVELVIQALSARNSTAEWKLLIAGTGPEEDRLRAMVRGEGLGEKVEFMGQVAPDRVAALLAETDILVQASYREGRPNAVLEAMAAGVPVIGSDIDGIHELIDHNRNGLLFPAGNAAVLADRLQALLGSPALRKRLGTAGRQTLVEWKLTWSACAASYMEIYQSMMCGARGSGSS
jgi:glycosyltransferase involved in cell wall biosynthesis